MPSLGHTALLLRHTRSCPPFSKIRFVYSSFVRFVNAPHVGRLHTPRKLSVSKTAVHTNPLTFGGDHVPLDEGVYNTDGCVVCVRTYPTFFIISGKVGRGSAELQCNKRFDIDASQYGTALTSLPVLNDSSSLAKTSPFTGKHVSLQGISTGFPDGHRMIMVNDISFRLANSFVPSPDSQPSTNLKPCDREGKGKGLKKARRANVVRN
jgi:hypothetical protein